MNSDEMRQTIRRDAANDLIRMLSRDSDEAEVRRKLERFLAVLKQRGLTQVKADFDGLEQEEMYVFELEVAGHRAAIRRRYNRFRNAAHYCSDEMQKEIANFASEIRTYVNGDRT